MDGMSTNTRGGRGGGRLLYIKPSLLIAKIVLSATFVFKARNGASHTTAVNL